MNDFLTASCSAVLDLAASQISFQELIAYSLMCSLNNNVNGLQALNFIYALLATLDVASAGVKIILDYPQPHIARRGGAG